MFCLFKPTSPFYLKFNISKTIYFLKRTWFLYVLSKYQDMFKISQWNTKLRKTHTLKIARSPPRNLVFIGHASIPPYRHYNTTKSIKFWLKIIPIYLPSIINFNYSIPFSIFHNTTKWLYFIMILLSISIQLDWEQVFTTY